MKISVAMAYYNGGTYIEEQMDSILSQLGEKDEVIVSVDGASDGSKPLLLKMAEVDSRIHIVKGPGKGVVRNFENAIRHCNGDIIYLSDQDDIWKPDKVEKVNYAFSNPEVKAVLHDAEIVDENGVATGAASLPNEMYMHDYWIGTAAEYMGKVCFLDKPLIGYRRHSSNVTQMTHGSIRFMIKKRIDIIRCLGLLKKRVRKVKA